MDNDLVVIETMSKVFTEHHQELATTLIEIFCHHQRVLHIISTCLAKVIQNEGNAIKYHQYIIKSVPIHDVLKIRM